MDRRNSMRKHARVQVRVRGPDGMTRWCRTANLSHCGAYLNGLDMNLRRGTPVEAVFVVTRGPVARLYRRWAIVAHCEPKGMGLMILGRNSVGQAHAKSQR